jgi:predicted permease
MLHDLAYSLRFLRRNPGYALAAMLCLALGIGVNTTAFSMVDELFLRPLPVPRPDRLVRIERGTEDRACSYREFEDLRTRTASAFAGLAAVIEVETALDTRDVSHIIVGEAVSANFADTLALRPQLGRWFRPEDAALNAEPVAVISDHAWAERFGRSPDVLGRPVRIETQSYRVVGVAPPEFRGTAPPVAAEVWVPIPAMPIFRERLSNPADRKHPRVSLIGRLAGNVTRAAAQTLVRAADADMRTGRSAPLSVASAAGAWFPGARQIAGAMTALLAAASAIVLLIACVNVANLMLSRAVARRRETAVRRAIGAGRWPLARQAVAEGILLACGGAALGLLFGYATNRLLFHYLGTIPETGSLSAVNLDVDWRVVAFGAAAALAGAILFTLSSAFEQSRGDMLGAIKGGAAPGRARQRDAYVVAQVALSLVLLVAAGLLVRALQRAQHIPTGFATDHRLSARIYISEPEYNAASARVFFDRVLAAVRGMPGVEGAALSYSVPLSFPPDYGGCAAAPETARPVSLSGGNTVSPGYFATLGIPLVAGRDFLPQDRDAKPPVVIVDQTLAGRLWPGGRAVGRRIRLGCDSDRAHDAVVIGVVGASKYNALDEPARGAAFGVHAPLPEEIMGFMALTIHTSGDSAPFAAPLRAAFRRIDPNLRIYDMRTLQECAALSLWKVRWQAALVGCFGSLAIVLAALGMSGVIAYAVEQRTREIGIRMAIGAQKSDVVRMVLCRGLRLTAAGVAIGVVLSAASTRVLRAFLYGVSPWDAVAFTAAALLWLVIATLASYFPARRAAQVDPSIALRWE